MTMFSALRKKFSQKTGVSEEDVKKIISALEVRFIRRKKNILNAGDDLDYMFFLNKGLIRGYIYDDKGDEQTTDLIAEGNWFCDFKAFVSRKKATVYFEAIENSHILLLSFDNIQRFYDEIPMFERAVRQTIEFYFIVSIDRAKKINYAGHSASDRYKEFTRKYPQLESSVPAKYLASYLGIKPETLSRLRHQYGKNSEQKSLFANRSHEFQID